MPAIEIASEKDSEPLARLVNSAYRGDTGRMGWTTEADLIDGTRTDAAMILETMKTEGCTLLKYTENDEIAGCVELCRQGDKMYLGMLTVSPLRQGKGIGKALMKAGEEWAKNAGCRRMTMTVITDRTELIGWYVRHGYHDTGERKPFAFQDVRNGIPRKPLIFMVLEKDLG